MNTPCKDCGRWRKEQCQHPPGITPPRCVTCTAILDGREHRMNCRWAEKHRQPPFNQYGDLPHVDRYVLLNMVPLWATRNTTLRNMIKAWPEDLQQLVKGSHYQSYYNQETQETTQDPWPPIPLQATTN